MLSPAAFITLSLVSYNGSVSLKSVVVIVVYFICLYLFYLEFTELLNLCVDVSIKFGKNLANIYIISPYSFLLPLLMGLQLHKC